MTLQSHVPSKKFIDEKSGLAVCGTGVVSIVGLCCASAWAFIAMRAVTDKSAMRKDLMAASLQASGLFEKAIIRLAALSASASHVKMV
jgi:hypothetical protein